MAKMEVLLRGKFRGSMLGVLSGDCLGCAYEGDDTLTPGQKLTLQRSFDKLEKGPHFQAPVMQFTDDSAMTRSLAQSLIEKGDLDIMDVAKKFVTSFFKEPTRGYGAAVTSIFEALRKNKFTDILGPAKTLFDGTGSCGNGGAMRVAPIALFCHKEYTKLLEMTRKETEITHSNELGINGAILQAIAIQQCLILDPEDELDTVKFVDELIEKMNFVENDDEFAIRGVKSYRAQLEIIKKWLKEDEGPYDEKVVRELGHDVIAPRSVPTAIFCFLRAQKPIKYIQTDNPWRRAIQYAISLGGDTDTIAAMAGAVAGAYYGESKISSYLLRHCEASDEFRELSDKLYEVSTS